MIGAGLAAGRPAQTRRPVAPWLVLPWGSRWLWVAIAAVLLAALPAEARAAGARKGKPAVEGVLNLNRASEAELRLLPGIGKGRAKAIVERRTLRPFASVDEVARMKGLSGVVKKLRRHLVVSGDSTLHPAQPGPAALQKPG